LLDSLSEYLDGDLGEDLCNELEHHMADCEDCRIVVDTLRKTIYLYHASSAAGELPEDVRQRLYLRLNLDEFLSNRGGAVDR
jgi:anti-sigma factor RsiW